MDFMHPTKMFVISIRDSQTGNKTENVPLSSAHMLKEVSNIFSELSSDIPTRICTYILIDIQKPKNLSLKT